MIHLVLDTNIYRSNPRLDSMEFTLLRRLVASAKIVLHVPYIVEREFATELEQTQRTKLNKAFGEICRALSFGPHGPESAKLAKQLADLRAVLPQLVLERTAAFLDWLGAVGAVRHRLTLEQAQKAMDAYFAGTPPLRQPKVRKDIPDSFIFQQILQLYAAHRFDLGVIVNDGTLRSALQDAGIGCWSTIREFLTSPAVQPLVAEEIIGRNRSQACDHVLSVATKIHHEIVHTLEQELMSNGQAILHGDDFPGETGEIYISGAHAPYEVDYGDVEYIGGTVFLLEVIARVELMYQFPIYKHDVLDLDSARVSLAPLNDHYFEAETTDVFQFSASIELGFPIWQTQPKDLDELKTWLQGPTTGVSELQGFELLPPDPEVESETRLKP